MTKLNDYIQQGDLYGAYLYLFFSVNWFSGIFWLFVFMTIFFLVMNRSTRG